MRHSQHDDPNLTEVKAVLERLHRISRGQHADDMQTAKKQALPRQFPQAAERLVPEEDPSLSPAIETAAPSDHPNVTKRRLLQAAAAIAVLLIVFGGIARFMALNRQTASVAPPLGMCSPGTRSRPRVAPRFHRSIHQHRHQRLSLRRLKGPQPHCKRLQR